jgi:glycogen operon protein
MIAHGDERGRTQQGNNNVYCQDNELSWVDWEGPADQAQANAELTEFTARLIALRRKHPIFRRQRFFQGRPIRGSNIDDIAWLRPDGQQMDDEDWNTGYARSVAIFLNGRGIPDRDQLGERVIDDSFLLLINGHYEEITFVLPDKEYGPGWVTVLDTAAPRTTGFRGEALAPGDEVALPARALQLLRAASR